MANVNGIVLTKIEEMETDENTKKVMRDLFRIQRDNSADGSSTYVQNKFKEIIERNTL